jgi:hypothetical protein
MSEFDNLGNDDDDDDLDDGEEISEEEMGESSIEINIDNVHQMVDVLFLEATCLTKEDLYRFILTPEIWGVEMSIEDLTDKLNEFIGVIITETTMDMAQEGILDMYYDEEKQDFVFGLSEEEKKKMKK